MTPQQHRPSAFILHFQKTARGGTNFEQPHGRGGLNGVPFDVAPASVCPGRSEFLLSCGNTELRAAIRNHQVTFPSQVVTFGGRAGGDAAGRIAQLYFVGGWSVGRLRDRYGLTKSAMHTLLRDWRSRAIAAGFIQEIDLPESAYLKAEWAPTAPPSNHNPVGYKSKDADGRSMFQFG